MSTEQMTQISATLDGTPLGIFDTLTGGGVSAEPTKHRPGGMGPEGTYAVLPTYDNLTIGRVRERERDYELVKRLERRSGRGRVVVTEQPLDDDGQPWGVPTTWTGRLGPIDPGGANSTSTAVRMFTLIVVVEDKA